MNLTPIEYEQYCASQLQLEGWAIKSTAVTGDQGADIVAESGAMRLIIQCKQYSQPVGNAAVQEVIAARIYYEGDVAMVVSNAPFTRSATELAKKATVHLLHHTKLRQWAKQNVRSKPNVGLKANELAAVLNLHGFRVARAENGGYSINTPAGVRYANTDGAFIQMAEGLLSLSQR
jgi:Holliday junction resolvase